jgi:hypothetical protein
VFDKYGKRFRPLPRKEIVVRCGEPVDMTRFRGRDVDAALLREVTDHLMTVVRELLAEVRKEPAPTAFYRRARAGADAAPDAGPVPGGPAPEGAALPPTEGGAAGDRAS